LLYDEKNKKGRQDTKAAKRILISMLSANNILRNSLH
jgi:hypothetical protein